MYTVLLLILRGCLLFEAYWEECMVRKDDWLFRKIVNEALEVKLEKQSVNYEYNFTYRSVSSSMYVPDVWLIAFS